MSELRRLLDKDNHKYIAEVKKRWDDFVAKVQFYGVSKKAMKPPMTLDGVEFSIALFKALPTLFPSPAAPPRNWTCQ
ncbi:Hemocyanin A-type units Ode to Odg [Dissostichus eleginoides]|uniref:Hemocyanin A-type units Ode to Odg n=1 Tax=Dissostichus eleginoides TaxID=100907 RepID=A0AAD9FI12_DISEL|nr:Hemocyanin A-type units Ode to Odg [Dissostichus eleginoides]